MKATGRYITILFTCIFVVVFMATQVSTAQDTPKKVLIVVTSHNVLGETGYPTGFWLTELTHSYFELHKHGVAVDIASVQGGNPPIDPYSHPMSEVSINKDDIVSVGFLNSPQHREKLENSQKLADVDLSQYDAIIFAGGNGALFDFADNKDVINAVETMWNDGKIVSALCHGSAALLNARLPDGEYLVKGRKVTGFSNEEEQITQSQIGADYLPFYLEDELKKRDGDYQRGPVFQSFAVVSDDGRLITGQQNMSGEEVGKAVVEALMK